MADHRLEMILTAKDYSKKAFRTFTASIRGVKNQVFSLKGAFVAIGAGGLAKSFLDAGMHAESLTMNLEAVTGSSLRAKEAQIFLRKERCHPRQFAGCKKGCHTW